MIRRRQTGSVFEVGVFHAQQLGLLVHDINEGVFATGNKFRKGD